MMWYLTGSVGLGIGLAIGWLAWKRFLSAKNSLSHDLLSWADKLLGPLLDRDNCESAIDKFFAETALKVANADLALLLEASNDSHYGFTLSGNITARASITTAWKKHRKETNSLDSWQQVGLEWEWPRNGDSHAPKHRNQTTWVTDYRTLSSEEYLLELNQIPGLWFIPVSTDTSLSRWLVLGGKQHRIGHRLQKLDKLVQQYLNGNSEFRKNISLLNVHSQAFDNSIVPKIIVTNNQIVQVSQGFEGLTGYRRDQLISQPLDVVILPEDVYDVHDSLAQLPYDQTESDIFETRFLCQDETVLHIALCPTIVNYQGEKALVIATKDITPRVNLEQSLVNKIAQQELIVEELMQAKTNLQLQVEDLNPRVEHLQQLAVFTENILAGVTHWIRVIDRDHNVTYLNQSMCEAMGNLVGKKCFQSLGFPSSCPQCPFNQVVDTNQPQKTEIVLGLHTYSVTCSPLEGPDGVVHAVVELIQDITELKDLQESMVEKSEILEAVNDSVIELNNNLEKATLELAQKNTELEGLNEQLKTLDQLKDNFVSTVSHELRAPLTSIKGSVGLILNGMVGKVDPKITQFLTVCQRNVDRLIHLIDDLLDLSKIESGRIQIRPTSCALKKIAAEAVEDLSHFNAEPSVELRVEVPEDLTVWVDHDRCIQLLQNLLSNALKFTEVGEVVIRARRSDDGVLIEVQDTGIGIPEDKLDNIFGKFTQVDSTLTRKVGGTGLGLAICQAIVKEHGGRISVQSETGKGSCFNVVLPDAPKDKKPAPKKKTRKKKDNTKKDSAKEPSANREQSPADIIAE